MALLNEVARLPTSGARAVEPFELDGRTYLVVPQLAEDIPGDPADMNGGESDVDTIVFVHDGDDAWRGHQRLPSHGGEGAACFTIGGRAFLAIAHIRSGRNPTFEYEPESVLYEWDGARFHPFQSFPTWAAKQAYAFEIEGCSFLAFAEAVSPPGAPSPREGRSHLYAWDGSCFEPFTELPTTWGYGFTHVPTGDAHYLALADHGGPSVLYRWNGRGFDPHQSFGDDGGGRHFATCVADGETYLAFANLVGGSALYRWDGSRFVAAHEMGGPGARHLRFLEHRGERYLFRTNFITGDRTAPVTSMDSELYRFAGGRLTRTETYPTSGGTEASPFSIDGRLRVAVSNSLSADVRFRTDTVVYALDL